MPYYWILITANFCRILNTELDGIIRADVLVVFERIPRLVFCNDSNEKRETECLIVCEYRLFDVFTSGCCSHGTLCSSRHSEM